MEVDRNLHGKAISTTGDMDAKLFRLPTKPNFYASIASANPFDTSEKQKRTQLAAPDARYPGWAAPMADGRLVTNYQNHCSRNVPTGYQYATKEWMTKNAEELMRIARRRFAQQTGAYKGLDTSVVPPPALIVSCTSAACGGKASGAPGGIGMERAGALAPPLFGTYDPTVGTFLHQNAVAPPLTNKYEGGRNTPRGAFAVEMK